MVKKIQFLLLTVFVIFANFYVCGDATIALALHHQHPEDTVFFPGQKCEFSWELVGPEKQKLPDRITAARFNNFTLTVNKQIGTSESLVAIHRIPLSVLSYSWKIPSVENKTTFWITVAAVPKSFAHEKAISRIRVEVQSQNSQEFLPQNFESCLRILMDWNGKRGYYKRCSPQQALERVKHACRFLRSQVEASMYNDYLDVIERVENSKLAPLRVYSREPQAQLHIDGWLVGRFESFDRKREMYRLQILLPIDSRRSYAVLVKKGKLVHNGIHTHTGSSLYIVDKLYHLLPLVIETGFEARVKLARSPYTEWGKRHTLQIYSGKAQTIRIDTRKGAKLKIYLNPKIPTTLQIDKDKERFIIRQNGAKHIAPGNEINLLEFR